MKSNNAKRRMIKNRLQLLAIYLMGLTVVALQLRSIL